MAKTRTHSSVAEILEANQTGLLDMWIENIRAVPGTRTLELMSEEQLRAQAMDLLRTLTTAFNNENYDDINQPQFADSLAMLRDISASRATQGFSPTETAIFVFSLQDALIHYLQAEHGDDPKLLNTEVLKMIRVIDQLGLITFEAFSTTREEVIFEQTRSLMDLSTPVIKLWDEIILSPLVGTIDTARAMQMTERLLQAIVDTESRVAILDITGVAAMDTAVAGHLLKTVAAVKLLGAEVVVTGIGTDTALTLTHLGIDLGEVRTRGTLRAGVSEAFRLVDKQVTSR